MRALLCWLAVFGILGLGACRPAETVGPDNSSGADQPQVPPADASAEVARAQSWDFEDAQLGSLPAGWSAAKTGEGPGSEWKVQQDESAPAGAKVLTQVSSEGPKPLFCLCIAEETSYADVDLSVSFKALQGKIDQGGGPMWRVQDENNYYVARMNPLEFNFRLYKVVDGKRTKLASADVEVSDEELESDDPLLNQWHTIRVVHRGDQIQCYLGGELLLQFEDNSIPDAGKVGLWAKADAVTAFDKLSVSAPSP